MHRKKEVFEDFKFDAEDKEELKRREDQTIALIKSGKLPETPKIEGQIDVKLNKFENIN